MARLIFFLSLLAWAGPLAAAAPEWLAGRWSGEGVVMGKATQTRLEVTPALSGAFVEFRYDFRTVETQPTSFEGRAFYRTGDGGRWDGHWFDSRGTVFPLNATLSVDGLTTDWGSSGTERGRTIYRRLPTSRLEVTDMVMGSTGAWRVFARHTLSRATTGSFRVRASRRAASRD